MTPVLTVFRQVLPGDVRKLRAESNDADTGGGARDLRFRGQPVVRQLLRMFTQPTAERGVMRGRIHWATNPGTGHADVELWRPTQARPNEVRLNTIHRIGGWAVTDQEFNAAIAAGRRLFFILTLDTQDRIWASIFDEAYLPEQTQIFRDHLAARAAATRNGRAITGAIDFARNETFP